jgi:hypothetical protein
MCCQTEMAREHDDNSLNSSWNNLRLVCNDASARLGLMKRRGVGTRR